MSASWVTEIIGAIAILVTSFKWLGDYLKARRESESREKIEKLKLESENIEEIARKYEEALKTISELKKKEQEYKLALDRSVTSFDMLYIVLEKHLGDQPDLMSLINKAHGHIKGSKKDINNQ